ncbi:alpha/beta fold hydrolase [Marinimicrobium sp. ABcell2]|uniref:alpha/beta fold hydrolase n=1 Tax=Marinimicrobium sp. ABcell2 TaxID=3069751 RepID=UPI0027AE7EE2|nr:alpha/beta hydrolase [Marinimicrobium sp. ABcell2]MDQ2077872.1 alpha/beta hydrolase [Marinimicrobium sp. ABcell2]
MRYIAWLCLLVSLVFPGFAAAKLSDLFLAEASPVSGELPSGWQAGYVKEPVFNGRMLVVEAGHEHSQTVILVHGLGQNGYQDWKKVMPVLAQSYHVIAMDLPGFGYSDKSSGRYSPTQYARLLHWLYEQTGREQVSLIGHSMGGAVALRFASSFPDLLDNLVLVSVAGVLERSAFLHHRSENSLNLEPLPDSVRQHAEYRLRRLSGKVLDLANQLPGPRELLQSDTVWNAVLKDSPNSNAALALIDENFNGVLNQISVPTLIVWGSEDPVAPLRTGRLLRAQIPDSELLIFDGTGHVPMARSVKFNQDVMDFLTGNRLPRQEAAAFEGPLEDLTCRGLNGVRYRGHYRTVRLINCRGIHLEDIHAQQIELVSSEATFLNVTVESEDVALKATGSAVKITNGTLAGEVGISAAHSRLDMAGVKVRGRESALVVNGASRLVFSISELHEPQGVTRVHGSYRLAANN